MKSRVIVVTLTMLLMLAPVFSQLILIGRDQEIEIGKEVAAELEKRYGVWDDPEQTRRIERIGRSLVAVCERKDMPYTFKILNERKELNAMAAPGGFIYITRALLEALESDDEVAFVLGHEIGHVAGDHIRKQLSQAIAGSILLDILTGGSSQLVRIGADIMFSLYQSGYSRQHERDADTRGVRYMKAAGYNPVAAITALRKLGMERYRGLVRWFGTHPDIPSRIQRIANMLGVDPETLQPLPGGAKNGALPKRSAALFYLVDNSIFRLPPNSPQPQKIWQLEKRLVEKFDISEDGKTLWVLTRQEGSKWVVLAILKEGKRRSEIASAFYAEEIKYFRRSPNGQWLAVLATENGRTFLKVFDAEGRELTVTGRTPLGEISTVQWTPDNKLLIFAERFGESSMAIWSHNGTIKFVPMGEKCLPSQIAVDGRKIFSLVGTTLKQGEIEGEKVLWQPIASPVKAFAVKGANIALVKGENLVLGSTKTREQQVVLDERSGEFSDLTFSKDGQWLAYIYRAKSLDKPQLWLAHVKTKKLWLIAINAREPKFAAQ